MPALLARLFSACSSHLFEGGGKGLEISSVERLLMTANGPDRGLLVEIGANAKVGLPELQGFEVPVSEGLRSAI